MTGLNDNPMSPLIESRQLVGEVGVTALYRARVRRPNGTYKDVAAVRRPDAVAVLPVRVVPVTGAREGLFVRQPRPVVDEPGLWEVPAGKVDPGEAPAATAVRELREETGYVTLGVHALATGLCVSPGYTTERMDIYAVTVVDTPVAQRAEDAGIHVAWRPLSRMFSPDMKTQLAVALALRDTTLWQVVWAHTDCSCGGERHCSIHSDEGGAA